MNVFVFRYSIYDSLYLMFIQENDSSRAGGELCKVKIVSCRFLISEF